MPHTREELEQIVKAATDMNKEDFKIPCGKCGQEYSIAESKEHHKRCKIRCAICNKELTLTLPHPIHTYNSKHYCIVHCPQHNWDNNYDFPTTCFLCGIDYVDYLEELLEGNGIKFQSEKRRT